MTKLKKVALEVRKNILQISHDSQVGHVGSAFSIVEILVALYFDILKLNPHRLNSLTRDRFILSKGHAAPALYAILYQKGIISKKQFYSYCQDGGDLEEHPTHHTNGIEFSTGSLGHGLSVGLGMALAAIIRKQNYRVFVIASDAECDEGEIWEAALSASHFHLNNLYLFLDYNKVQALGAIKDVLNLEPLKDKWLSFGWNVQEVDGHNIKEIASSVNQVKKSPKPNIIICHTIRGKGVSFMEHKIDWHYLTPTDEHYQNALLELDK